MYVISCIVDAPTQYNKVMSRFRTVSLNYIDLAASISRLRTRLFRLHDKFGYILDMCASNTSSNCTAHSWDWASGCVPLNFSNAC
jgi:hypothetical protein